MPGTAYGDSSAERAAHQQNATNGRKSTNATGQQNWQRRRAIAQSTEFRERGQGACAKRDNAEKAKEYAHRCWQHPLHDHFLLSGRLLRLLLGGRAT
jgi:hypothetical protein